MNRQEARQALNILYDEEGGKSAYYWPSSIKAGAICAWCGNTISCGPLSRKNYSSYLPKDPDRLDMRKTKRLIHHFLVKHPEQYAMRVMAKV